MVSQSSPRINASLTITQGMSRPNSGNTRLVWPHPSPNTKTTQAQLITDFTEIFLYSARAVRDTMCHSHLRHKDEQLMPTENHHRGQLWQPPRGRPGDSSSDPSDGSSLRCASRNKKYHSVHCECSLRWFLSVSVIVSHYTFQ